MLVRSLGVLFTFFLVLLFVFRLALRLAVCGLARITAHSAARKTSWRASFTARPGALAFDHAVEAYAELIDGTCSGR